MNIFNKTIILIVSLIFAFPVLAQKIKVKKDIIYIDKVEIPIKVDSEYLSTKGGISGDFHQVLTFSDATTSENFIIVDHIGKMTNVGGVKEVWFEISDVSKTKTNSVDFDREFGGGKKGIIKHLLNKYQFFTKEGSIDKDKISAFLLTSTTSTTKEKANKAIANNTEIEAKVTEINPFVQNDLTTITKGGRLGTEVIGHLTSPDKYHDTRTTPIKVYDLDDNMIASATTDILSPVTVSLIGGASFEYKSKTQLNGGISNQRFLTELLENLIRKGFFLGHAYNASLADKQEQLAEENLIKSQNDHKSFQEALAKTNHFFEKKGYVITEEGEKIEGPITILFEKVNHDIVNGRHTLNGVGYATGDGSVLSIKTTNKKGKLVDKRIKAKENVSFVIFDENGKETMYKSLTMGNTLFKDWRFHELLETYNNIDIYKSYKKNLIIKKEDKEKAYYVDYKFSLEADKLTRKEKIKLVKFFNYLCEIEDLPEDEEDLDVEGLGITNVIELIINQFDENNIVAIKKIIDATKDCVIKQ